MTGAFWRNRRVLITGHTGFKGSWLTAMLRALGAEVSGLALPPPTEPSMFVLLGLGSACDHCVGDIRDAEFVARRVAKAAPEVIFHMAAQPLVRASYDDPVGTYAANVMGTVHLLEAARLVQGLRAVVAVTTDKVYENKGWHWGYRESDRLGGTDPYSNSKAASELVVTAYRDSYFPIARHADHGVAIASARAGNVIGGGDFAADRLVPDAARAFGSGEALLIRNPLAIRPWQHVLEPLAGYCALAERLHDDARASGGWNFGPRPDQSAAVGQVADRVAQAWGDGASWQQDLRDHPHEAATLKLDPTKAMMELGWRQRLSLDEAVALSVDWYRCHAAGGNLSELTNRQIADYLG